MSANGAIAAYLVMPDEQGHAARPFLSTQMHQSLKAGRPVAPGPTSVEAL